LAVAVAGVTAARAGPAAVVPRPVVEQGLGQVLDTGDAFATVREVLSWSLSHDRHLPWARGRFRRADPTHRVKKNPFSLLQCRPNPRRFQQRNVVSPLSSLLRTPRERGKRTARRADGAAGRGRGRKRMPTCNGSDRGCNITPPKGCRLPSGV